MQRTKIRVPLCVLLAALLLSGCVSSLVGMFGESAQSARTSAGAQDIENLAEFIGTSALGATALVRDPRSGEQAELRVEGEYFAGTGETCRRADLVNADDKSRRFLAACQSQGVWTLVPEILSAPGTGGR